MQIVRQTGTISMVSGIKVETMHLGIMQYSYCLLVKWLPIWRITLYI